MASPNIHMTNNLRLYLWIALGLLVFLNYEAWMADYGPKPQPVSATAAAERAKQASDLSHEVPLAAPTTEQPNAGAAAAPATTPAPAEAGVDTSAKVVHVVTDVLALDISTRGGT